MSTHPNAILKLTLTPDDLPMKTYRAILADCGVEDEELDRIKIEGEEYSSYVSEGGYDEGWQLEAKDGAILVFDMVTYGYGEEIMWDDLTKQKDALEEWAKGICERHACSYAISVTANYW